MGGCKGTLPDKKEIAEIILAAAQVDEYEKLVYSVGPFGLRVGFAFQQKRALNIVASMKIDGQLENNPRIAIIGGGIAGITAYLALHALGVNKTKLYEINSDVVRIQHDAAHRPIHPCYNNWPMVNFFNPTTNFPFFNWFADNAKNVADSLLARWKGHYATTLPHIMVQHKVEKMELVNDSKEIRLYLKKKNPGGKNWISIDNQDFNLIIIATGFGKESELEISRSDSYWTPDQLNTLREDDGIKNIYVSGIGDGGLIDCIRGCFREIDNTNLMIELISHLRHKKYHKPRESIEDPSEDPDFEQSPIEADIRRIEKRAIGMLPKRAPVSQEDFGSSTENEISEFLHEEYQKIIKTLPQGAKDLLSDRKSQHYKKVTLIGKFSHPFSCNTAPINKLIIAYILSEYPDLYVRGYIKIIKQKPHLITFAGENKSLASDPLIIRHGANPPVYTFSKSFKENNLTLLNSVANFASGDKLENGLWNDMDDFCEHIQNVAEHKPKERSYFEFRQKLAMKFGVKYLCVEITPNGEQTSEEKPAHFEFNPNRSEFRDLKDMPHRQMGGFPHEIFGVKLIARRPEKVKPALGTRE